MRPARAGGIAAGKLNRPAFGIELSPEDTIWNNGIFAFGAVMRLQRALPGA